MQLFRPLSLSLVLALATTPFVSAQQAPPAPAGGQSAQTPRAPRPKLPGEQWVQLFNGKDLTGWQKIGNEQWNVEPGGILHGVAVTKAYGYLRTEKNYKDFQLALQFKCDGDGNSGVFFHSEFKPGTPDITQGLQFEIDCQATDERAVGQPMRVVLASDVHDEIDVACTHQCKCTRPVLRVLVLGHADLVGGRAHVRIEEGDVTSLTDDQLALLGGLRLGRPAEGGGRGRGGAERGGGLQQLASGQ